MAGKIKNYFLPFMRRGVAVQSKTSDGKRQLVNVVLKVAGGSSPREVKKDIAIYGPGDVLGFNKSIVAGNVPVHNETKFRADDVAYIEFAEPDFLWRFSNSKYGNDKYWIPWLSLIVLEPGHEFELATNQNSELPPAIELNNDTILPDLSAMWRWAHVHFQEEEGLNDDAIKNLLKYSPNKAVCRLMCPRRLKENTRYMAFVVPTYKLGMQAALGEEQTAGLADLSWAPNSNPGKLPYYFSWVFETSIGGDFETLVSQFKGYKPSTNSPNDIRKMDCSSPGYDIHFPPGNDYKVVLEGALRLPGPSSAMNTLSKEKIQMEMEVLLNKNNSRGTPIVLPPVYGQWYTEESAPKNTVTKNNGCWRDELNLDFRYRLAASLGAQFIRENQEELVQFAWEQLEETRKANQALNLGRFGRAVSDRFHKRAFGDDKTSDTGTPYQFRTGLALKSKILQDGKQIADVVETSNLSYHATKLKTQKYFRKVRPLSSKPKLEIHDMDKRNQLNPKFRTGGLVGIGSEINEIKQISDKNFKDLLTNQATAVYDGMKAKPLIEARLTNKIIDFREKEIITTPFKIGTASHARMRNEAKDVLRDIIWYPEFHTPLYGYLRDKSIEWIAPFLASVPQNTIGLLETNSKFIESFMIGANHEFASELRWREFPTDMKGSYFRKFWDTTIYSVDNEEKQLFRDTRIAADLVAELMAAGLVSNSSTPESILAAIETYYTAPGTRTPAEKNIMFAYEEAIERWLLTRDEDKDIEHPINWGETSALGKNALQGNSNQIVILIKGDLLRKFPNAMLYLVKKGTINLDTAERTFPIFEGQVPPDTVFMGFPISARLAAEYNLVFEEPMADARLGLDEWADGGIPFDKADSSDTTWQHFGVSGGDFLDHRIPSNLRDSWKNPAYIASVFVQQPVRLIVPLKDFIDQ